jgi:hypothetical protein
MASYTKTAAFGTYSSGVDLHSLTRELNDAGFSSRGVCVLLPLIHPAAQTLRALKAGELTLESANEVETVLAWIGKFGAVVIPGIGLFISDREFSGILLGTAKRALAPQEDTFGALLESLGLSSQEVWYYEDWVHAGGIVVYVCCDDSGQLRQAREILESATSQGNRPLDMAQVTCHWEPQAFSLAG